MREALIVTVVILLLTLGLAALLNRGETMTPIRKEPAPSLASQLSPRERAARDNIVPADWPKTAADMPANYAEPQSQSTPVQTPAEADLDRRLNTMLAAGAIHSVDIGNCTVRIDPEIWQLAEVEGKRQIVAFFHDFFRAKGRPGYPTILSSRNDQKFATYGVWAGIKILQ